MNYSICGANCADCGFGKNNNCKGCTESKGCPFGKQCFIYSYIKLGGMEGYKKFKKQLADEFNALKIDGLPKINDLFAMNGSYVNLSYPMPSGEVKLLNDNEIYLCNQVECEFDDGESRRCFGLVASPSFLLVSEYGENGADPVIILYKKR